MKPKKLFLIFCILCSALALSLGFAACGEKTEPEVQKIPVFEVKLDKTELDLETGDEYTLTATVLPSNASDKSLSWRTSNESVATVDGGKVTATGAGTASVTVAAGGKEAVCRVTVTEKAEETVPVDGVSLNRTALTLTEGETFDLVATVTPANATNKTVSWKSDSARVTVSDKGVVSAVSAGSATVTATADGKSATCKVTVKAPEPVVIPVTGVTLNKDTIEIEEGETFNLVATVLPANATSKVVVWSSSDGKVATVDEEGFVTAKAAGVANIIAKAGTVQAVCEVGVIKKQEEIPPDNGIVTYARAGQESAAFEWSDTKASAAKVEYRLTGSSAYTRIDKQLIRQISPATARADILGLKGGAKYDFKITSGDGKTAYANGVAISSHDRAGFAHSGYTKGVGAYNDDGTLKSGAVIIYVTEENKNDVDGKGNSIAEYLANAKNNKSPIVVRIIGTVGSATWNEIEYNSKGHEGDDITVDKVKGVNGKQLPTDNNKLTQAELIKGGYNTLNEYPEKLNGKKCGAIDGLVSKAKYTAATDKAPAEYDSAWNDCQVQNVSNITVEGVGEDAEIFQWGITFKNCNSVEVRNIRFYDYTEDACSIEGSENSQTLAGFKHKNFWIHHNVFDIGVNYWDVCPEQDKHDGDGATDFKYLSHITISYNRYNGTHKTGLVGGSDSAHQACFTFHHNFYNGCDQRMPLGRQANMHMYNNYYKSSGLYSISLRAGAYAFIENCAFTSGKDTTKPIELVKGSNGVPSAKVVGCEFEGKIKNELDGKNLYVGDDRDKTVEGGNLYGLNFELKDGFYTVGDMLDAKDVSRVIPEVAGTAKRVSNIDTEGGGEEPPVVDPDPDPDPVDPAEKISLNISDAIGTVLTVNSTSHEIDATLVDGAIDLKTSSGKVTKRDQAFGDETYTHRVVLKGVGNYFALSVDSACTIKVYVANGSTSAGVRYLGLYTDTKAENIVGNTVGLDKTEATVAQFAVTDAGVYYLESITNELSIYKIEIIS